MAFIPNLDKLNSLKPGEIPSKDAHGQWTSITPQTIVTTSQEADPKGASNLAISNHKSERIAHAITQIDGLETAFNSKQNASRILSAISVLTSSGALQIKSDGTALTFTVSDAAKALLDDADIPAIRNTLGLGTAAIKAASEFEPSGSVVNAVTSLGLNLGGKQHTRSRIAPTSPNPGDTWEELDSADQIVMYWYWSGAYWLTPDIDKEDLPLVATNNPITHYFAIANNYNIFLRSFTVSTLVSNTNTAVAYWTLTLGKVAANNTITAISSTNTSALAANSWRANTSIVNTLVTSDNSAVAFSFAAAKVLTPAGTVGGAMQITYQLARK